MASLREHCHQKLLLTTAIARLLLAKLPCFCDVILIMPVTYIWNMIKNDLKK